MDYLTIKEYSELTGYTVQYSRKLVRDGKIQAEQRPHPQNKKMCYMIPVSALPEELQAKYYGRLKAEINLPALKEDKKPVKKPKKSLSKTFEEMSEAERHAANVWSGIIEEWLNIRSRYENKAQADRMYVGKCQLEHPELQISRDILYRKLQAYKADNTLAFPVTEESLLAACVTKIRYLRENVGRGVKAVVPDYKADYEGIINVTNSVVINGVSLTNAQATVWVAGADASASNIQSNTYKIYTGAEKIVNPKTHEQAVAAIQNGEFFFSYSESGDVVVEYDINSLTTFTDKKDKSYSKNRVLRVLDSFAEAIRINFPPNKYSNNENGWDVMDGMGRSILKRFDDAGAIQDVDYNADFAVVRGESIGDSTYFNVAIKPVDSAEKLYFTVKTR